MELLALREIANRTGLPIRTLRNWVHKRYIKGYYPTSRVLMIDFQELQEFIKRRSNDYTN